MTKKEGFLRGTNVGNREQADRVTNQNAEFEIPLSCPLADSVM